MEVRSKLYFTFVENRYIDKSRGLKKDYLLILCKFSIFVLFFIHN